MGDPLGWEDGTSATDTAGMGGNGRLGDSASGAVVLPIKAFSRAKERLAGVLGGAERAELARRMADIVILAARPLPVIVACDDGEVATWAGLHGAEVSWSMGLDLNGAISKAVAVGASRGFTSIAVIHTDLPLAKGFSHLFGFGGVTLVPDLAGLGTNACCLPTDIPFRFSYGEGSLRRHYHEALRHNRGVRIVKDRRLGRDIDVAADLVGLGGLLGGPMGASTGR